MDSTTKTESFSARSSSKRDVDHESYHFVARMKHQRDVRSCTRRHLGKPSRRASPSYSVELIRSIKETSMVISNHMVSHCTARSQGPVDAPGLSLGNDQ